MSKELSFRIVLTLLWIALWESYSVAHVLTGYVLATGITMLFTRLSRTKSALQLPKRVADG